MAETDTKDNEQVFYQKNVVVYVSSPLKEEAAFSGALVIVRKPHGPIVKWDAIQQVVSNRTPSPEIENLGWEDISSAAVGYKANTEHNKDSIEIKSKARPPNQIVFDVADIKSFKMLQSKQSENTPVVIVVSIFLKDGSSIPAFHFVDGLSSYLEFLSSLKGLVTIKSSKKDSNLYLVNDFSSEALEKSFSELQLFDNSKSHIVTKFIHNPVETAMGGFSKVTNLFLNNFEYVINGSGTSSPSFDSNKRMLELLNDSLPAVDFNLHEEPGYMLISHIHDLPPRLTIIRDEPVSLEEWQSHMDAEGRINDVDKLKRRIFKGGLMNNVRPEAWKFLLGYYSFYSSSKEREAQSKQKVDDYYRMKLQWMSISRDQESRFSAFREKRNIIEKDVSRTDRTHPFFEGEGNPNLQMLHDILMTYCMHNFDLGYVQGMSDLLSPILFVLRNEADAFWSFAKWMDKVGINFELDQQGMKTQLQNLHRLLHFVDPLFCEYLENHESGNMYFAFRWLLILFKREFKFLEIMRMWEVLWTELPCKNFHILICLAILDTEKSTIIENKYGLTEVLKHINDMAFKINLDESLSKAEAIYLQIEACSHLSDIVRNILGIETPVRPPRKLPTPGTVERVRQRESSPISPKSKRDENSIDSPKSINSNNGVNIDEYVDLEKQCEYPFSLFS